MAKKPVMLVILDGFGHREAAADNAVAQANKPNFDRLWAASPHAFLATCGRVVGLPDGQMGNSEVGHLNIGAGRVVMQELPRIDTAIEDGSLAKNPALTSMIAALQASGNTCHLLGLISPGGVHSHQDQAVELAKIITAEGVPVVVHALLDGRDTPPQSAVEYLMAFEAALPANAHVGTVIGRYYAMDRDQRWERVQLAYDLIVAAQGAKFSNAVAAVEASYADKITDEFVKPATIGNYKGLTDGDAVVSFNFRADRVREILTALLDPAFAGFVRTKQPKISAAIGMTAYSDALAPFMQTLFAPQKMDELLGEVVSAAGLTQLRMAETEKYPHVTYFLNGGREVPYEGEDRIMVASPKVATYDLQPEMSAPELTEKAVAAINSGAYDMIILNFANPDMVGHTGSLKAAIKAVETVDMGLGKIADAIAAKHGALLVTADHGNCELMRDEETGEPHTAHTLNPVPVLLAGGPAGVKLNNGILADLAPTLLALLNLPQPELMTGKSLIA
ncbi:MAG TPA: 2,3-bisphosphoglycerate-independent phosphoglycerate mutase [Acidocella sp.]|nr:MAG: phosphoglycerate mutase (2,3-diphosphoglycerate-independent) [Acidocella sp. 21-58-7]HQU03459.1 2,3-bisphosphoglycerate-independent phosphoglycerate mutase [Acidocella sp.]